MHTIDRLTPQEFADGVKDLAEVLADAVDDGSSLGFVHPFDREAAAAWWRAQAPAVADGSLAVWVCREGGTVTGTVGLALPAKPNARHRAEVVKLVVHRGARGRGVGRALLGAVQDAAAAAGATLLMLDTETGSAAERLYLSDGWTRYGVVPRYAADPAGTPRPCSFFYKELTARPGASAADPSR